MGKQCGIVSTGYRRDHAVDQTSGCDAYLAALAVDARRTVEVCGRVESKEVEAQEQPA
jgi:hypothetical protein